MSFPLKFPNIPIRKFRIGLAFNQATFPGEFSRGLTIHHHAGGMTDRWLGTLTTPPLTFDQGREMRSFVSSLQGLLGRFSLCDPDHKNPSTFISAALTCDSTFVSADDENLTADDDQFPGQGFVKGTGQGGNTLLTDGWPANSTVLKLGDRFQIATQYFVLTNDALSDGNGEVTLTFEPAIRQTIPDNAPVITQNPLVVVRLQTPSFLFQTESRFLTPVTLAFEEAL